MATMDPLHIALLVLIVAAVWAVVELALTIKKARTSIDEVTRSANDTIEQLQPIISKADGMVDDLQPSMKKVTPLLESAIKTVDTATVSLDKVNDILGDVSDVSGAASAATSVASGVVDSAANAAVGLVSKITGKPAAPHAEIGGADRAKLTDGEQEPAPEPAPVPGASGYVTYGEQGDDEPAPVAGRHAAPVQEA
ncbi:MAG: DUF948 domain-containing protein [Olegusella sp.]|nr:DUF948 domain-containing protein [Olegusella sp.]